MTRTIQPLRRLGALAVVVGFALAVLLPAGAASAAAYRYWGYYQLNGTTWQFASTGPDQTKPADGAVEGWRFAVGTEDSTRFPRATPTFDDICKGSTAKSGEKRVAVVIDYGRTADSADGSKPPAAVGRCAVVDSAATGLEVLSKVADVRSEKGLICGIDSYPASGCGDTVATVSPEAQAADAPVTLKATASGSSDKAASDSAANDSHTGTYVGIGVALLAVLAVGGLALSRRRRA